MTRRATLPLLVACALALAGGLAAAQDGLEPPRVRRERGLVFKAPEGWRPTEPIEPERAAWTVRPDPEGPRLRVTLLRHRVRRPLAERVATWAGHFEGEDGEPLAADAAEREEVDPTEADGVTATLVALRGTFSGPLDTGEERRARPGWAALHLVVDGPDATWVASLVGPAAVVDRCRDGMRALARDVRVGLIDPDVEPDDGGDERR
ncbi:MAG: hypothetical protein KF878_17555 [Planctomycetes bacterium]|nr:hypothetical protein [Planctomycetota bacterium]